MLELIIEKGRKEQLWNRYYTKIQNSKESIKSLAKKYGINHKTVTKWKKRDFVHDAKMGPKDPHSTVLTREEEAACITFTKHTLLSLDDCLYAQNIPHLSRSSLHRLFQRHGISRLPKAQEKKQRGKSLRNIQHSYLNIRQEPPNTKLSKTVWDFLLFDIFLDVMVA